MEPQSPVSYGGLKVLGFLIIATLIAFLPMYFFHLEWFAALGVVGIFCCVRFVYDDGWIDWTMEYRRRNVKGYADQFELTAKEKKFERGRFRFSRFKPDRMPENIDRVSFVFQISGWGWGKRKGMIFYNWSLVDYPWRVEAVFLPDNKSVDWNWTDVWGEPGKHISHVHLSRIGEEGVLLLTVEKALEIIMEHTKIEHGCIKTTPLYKISESLYTKKMPKTEAGT